MLWDDSWVHVRVASRRSSPYFVKCDPLGGRSARGSVDSIAAGRGRPALHCSLLHGWNVGNIAGEKPAQEEDYWYVNHELQDAVSDDVSGF